MLAPSVLISSSSSVVDSLRAKVTALEVSLLSARGQFGRMARMFGVREDDASAILKGADCVRRLDELASYVSLCRQQLADSIASPFGFEQEASADLIGRLPENADAWTTEEILAREG